MRAGQVASPSATMAARISSILEDRKRGKPAEFSMRGAMNGLRSVLEAGCR